MKTWAAFLKDVRPSAPGIPEPRLEHAVLRAAQDFCDRTRAWKVELDPTTTRAGAVEYDLELERNVELVRIESATLNGIPFAVWRDGDLPRSRYVYTPDSKTLMFGEPMEAGARLVLTCTVKPGNAAAGIDDALFDRYVTLIALKAVSIATGDMTKRLDYESQCDALKTRLWRGNAAIRPRTRPNFF